MDGQRPDPNSKPVGQLGPGNVWAWNSHQGWVERPNPFPATQQQRPQFGAIGQSLMSRDAEIQAAPVTVQGVMPTPESAIREVVRNTTGYDSPLLGLSLKNPMKKPLDALKFVDSAPKYAKELYSLWSGGPVQRAP